MIKKKLKYLYLATGFLAASTYFVACGGGSSTIAQAVTDAINVLFDNTESGLAAGNVQDAIDELNEKVEALQAGGVLPLKQSDLVGTWNGVTLSNHGNFENISLTLNSNGTYSCAGDDVDGILNNRFESIRSGGPVCQNPISWEITKRALKLNYSNGSNQNVLYPVTYVDGSNMEMLTGEDEGHYVTTLSK